MRFPKFILGMAFCAASFGVFRSAYKAGTAGLSSITDSVRSLVRPIQAAEANDEVHIHYGPQEDLERIDIAALRRATGHLDIAMYSFTDLEIAREVSAAANHGVYVRLYRDRSQFNEERKRNIDALRLLSTTPNIETRVSSGHELMHLKQWSDGQILREGSANWSKAGECRQDNTLVLSNNAEKAAVFERVFDQIWSRRSNIRIQ